MVGALLVAVAAVVVFASYLDAVGSPTDRYLVTATAITAGTAIADEATARELFTAAALDLADPVSQRAVREQDLPALVGRTVVVPLASGELVQRSALADGAAGGTDHVLSFALPSSSAVGGNLAAGQTIDVVATSGRGGTARTGYVVRAVSLIAVESVGGGSSVLLTVALSSVEEVQILGHAVNTAEVFVVRAPTDGDRSIPDPVVDGDPQGAGEVEDG